MKHTNKLVLVLMAVMYSGLVIAQDAIDKYFKQYADDPTFTSIVISSKMFELFAKMDVGDTESKEMKSAMSGLKGIRILSSDESTSEVKTDYIQAIKKVGKEYELLMSVDEKDEKIRFFIMESGDVIKELLMIVGGNGNLFLMSISGDIDLAKMSSLSKTMNIGGMNYLENIDEKGKK
jgi:hypothetical protein